MPSLPRSPPFVLRPALHARVTVWPPSPLQTRTLKRPSTRQVRLTVPVGLGRGWDLSREPNGTLWVLLPLTVGEGGEPPTHGRAVQSGGHVTCERCPSSRHGTGHTVGAQIAEVDGKTAVLRGPSAATPHWPDDGHRGVRAAGQQSPGRCVRDLAGPRRSALRADGRTAGASGFQARPRPSLGCSRQSVLPAHPQPPEAAPWSCHLL